MADILRPIQPGDSWVTDEYGNVTGVALSLTGQQTKLPRLTNSSTTPAASRQTSVTADGNGNVGISVAPSAANNTLLQGPDNFTVGSAGPSINTASNTYWNGGWKYATNNPATMNRQAAGVHYWYTAPSGTAGNTIAFTQAMTLDGNGNLGLGVTPPALNTAYRSLSLTQGSGLVTNKSNDVIAMQSNAYVNAAGQYAYSASTIGAANYQQAVGTHQWFVAPTGTAGNTIAFTQAMTIDNNGNLLVGTAAIEGQGGVSVLPNSSQGATRIAWNRAGTANTTFALDFKDNNVTVGSVSYTNTATAYNTASDYRLKLDQKPLTDSGAFIDALKPKTWSWSADGSRGVGFIAHEVQAVSPTSVTGEKDAMRVEQYEISPAVPATYDEEGNELTPAIPAVMGEREVPAYQSMEYGSAEFIANIVAELQSLRKRVAALEAK